uniref:Mitochondrial carrier 2 n=1 Tax=Lygus hesperus TaxID=30085 RepID=A0A146KTG9_LYGHE
MSPQAPAITLSSLGLRLCIDTVTHPLEYAKFLVQIGHEPLPPFPTKTLFGRPAMGLPNCFKYVQYIHSIDGWRGCYKGVVPKLIGRTVGSCAAATAVGFLDSGNISDLNEDMELSSEEKLSILKSSVVKDIVGRTCMVFASQPFLVISNRMMAEFVGREDKYRGIFSSIAEIFREEGIIGFFSGVIPRWVGELIYVGLSSLVIYSINNYMIADYELRSFTSPTVQYLTSSVVYQFFVVSSCMSVNDCGLAAGRPPNMPIYKSWLSCRQELSMYGQLNRGSSPFFRYYFAPPSGLKTLASG